jgi:hypothetical protein
LLSTSFFAAEGWIIKVDIVFQFDALVIIRRGCVKIRKQSERYEPVPEN